MALSSVHMRNFRLRSFQLVWGRICRRAEVRLRGRVEPSSGSRSWGLHRDKQSGVDCTPAVRPRRGYPGSRLCECEPRGPCGGSWRRRLPPAEAAKLRRQGWLEGISGKRAWNAGGRLFTAGSAIPLRPSFLSKLPQGGNRRRLVKDPFLSARR